MNREQHTLFAKLIARLLKLNEKDVIKGALLPDRLDMHPPLPRHIAHHPITALAILYYTKNKDIFIGYLSHILSDKLDEYVRGKVKKWLRKKMSELEQLLGKEMV